MMHIPWDELQLFVAVADAGSLSGAAKRLGVTQPTVSRRLAELEASLGDTLFARSADGAALTSLGERMLPSARQMAEHAAELERITSGADIRPRGVVRVTAPPGIAYDFVAPFAVHARQRLPDVSLEVVSAIHYLDLSRREADLAIRTQASTQRDLVTLASFEHAIGLFATKSYIASLPRGFRLADIGFIGWAPPFDHLAPNPLLAAKIPHFRPTFASDDYLVQLRAAEAGMGAMFLGQVKHRFQPRTELVEMDIDFGVIKQSVHLVCAKSALGIPRIRAVAELLASEVEKVAVTRRPARGKQ